MRRTKENRSLICKLTDAELKEYSKKLAESISEKARVEDDLKSFSTQSKAKIQGCDATINLLSEKINTEREYRMVECEIKYDFKKMEKKIVRKDTGEVIDTDIISEEEKQEELEVN